MAKKDKNENLKPFKKGFDERRNLDGRARKWINTLKDSGYKKSEITDVILVMMSMTLEDIKKIFEDPNSTMLEKTISNAMFTSLKKGSLYSLETLLNRAIGMPTQTNDVSLQMQFNVEAPNQHTKNLIDKL